MEKNDSYLDSLDEQMYNCMVQDLGGRYIGTGHLLYVLLESSTTIAEYLEKQGITAAKFKKAYESLVGINFLDDYSSITDKSYTPSLSYVIDEVKDFASNKDVDITPEIVMCYLMRNGEGVAIRVLDIMDFGGRKLETFDKYLSEKISTANMGVDLGGEFEQDDDLDIFGESSKNKMNCLTDLRRSVKKKNVEVVGFDKELEDLIKALLRYKKPNIILVGEPGVGKTALVEKFAIAINEGKVPPILKDYRIMQLSLSIALAGTKFRGEFEEKIEKILSKVSKADNIVLFIDEIHNIVGAGSANDSSLDAGNILKPYLARGDVKIIGATTNEEYERIKEDGALARRFKVMEILEPDKEQTMNILKAQKKVMYEHYGVKVTNKMLDDIYYKSTYRKGRMPDIALDELEEYCIDIYYEKCKKEKDEKEKVNV